MAIKGAVIIGQTHEGTGIFLLCGPWSLCEAELGRGGGTVPCFVSALGVSCALTLELTRSGNGPSRRLKFNNHG